MTARDWIPQTPYEHAIKQRQQIAAENREAVLRHRATMPSPFLVARHCRSAEAVRAQEKIVRWLRDGTLWLGVSR